MSAPKRKSREVIALEKGLVLSSLYWEWLTDPAERDITTFDEATRWDYLMLESHVTDETVSHFRSMLFDAVQAGRIVVRPDVKHRVGDGKKLAAALTITQ